MTRSEFIDTVNEWEELIDFCRDEGCDICVGIYDELSMDDFINEYLVDLARSAQNWYSFRDDLNAIPSGAGWYLCNGYFDWEELTDDDFEYYKQDVLRWMDNRGYWDEEFPDDEHYCEDDEDWLENESVSSGIDITELKNLIVN